MLHVVYEVINVIHTQVAGGVTKFWPGTIPALRPHAVQGELIPSRAVQQKLRNELTLDASSLQLPLMVLTGQPVQHCQHCSFTATALTSWVAGGCSGGRCKTLPAIVWSQESAKSACRGQGEGRSTRARQDPIVAHCAHVART